MGGNLIEIETDKDHVHLLAELTPNKSLSEQINVLKGVTSRLIRRDYGDVLKQQLWGGALWSASYYIASAGGVTIDTLKQYVESQKTDDHKRKYEKTGKYRNAHRRKHRRANSSTT